MTSILQELQAGYEQRAQMALERAPEAPEAPAPHFATRTYTGAALERRRAWGREHGGFLSEYAASKRRRTI